MRTLQPSRQKLARAQTAFFRAADAIPGEKWDKCPGLNQWSAAELVAHLVVVERGVVTNADRLTQRAPSPIPFPKRLHFPMWLGRDRVIPRKTPVAVDERLKAEKETRLAGSARAS